jgi:hypothetical protein
MDGRRRDRDLRDIRRGMRLEAWSVVRLSMEDRPAKEGKPPVQTLSIGLRTEKAKEGTASA